MKAIDLITRALVGAGILASGETPKNDEVQTGLQVLNDMLDSWSVSRLFVYQLLEENFPLTVGKGTYTIGPGGDFSTARPIDIQSCYARLNNVDYPITLIDNDAYSDIGLKASVPGLPLFLYYDPQTPLGEINFWPVPSQAMTFFIQTPRQLTQFTDQTADVTFPPGYAEALRYGLIVRLAAEFGLPVSQAAAELSKSSIERLQTNNSTVPVLRPEFSTGGSGRFNILRGY
ncbi:hypothetical protein SAMN06265795_12645 [Noviherbaspirillum humi]|uniref:Uncharacterized protein n=1 Tax=Noviherbaspirillum humi TaxID=1688639 RepID=A0A239LVU5_9BURK|nr:hypothetical protein [Noviherbaspirillum humi]SNT33744.1 hypothetical protein SAMN06265795_12645 [Noviherbaspirillum humi]